MQLDWKLVGNPTRWPGGGQADGFPAIVTQRRKIHGIAFGLHFLLDCLRIDNTLYAKLLVCVVNNQSALSGFGRVLSN